MTLTVRDALELPALRAARPEVVAGKSQLGRRIRWVHVAELPDIAPLLNGGELLLTTGMGLRDSAAARRRYIRQLAGAGVAGVVVELGRNFTTMPPEMVQTAGVLGIPLIALGAEVRFVDVTEQVHRAIISKQSVVLRRVDRLNREFANLLLGGAGIDQILYGLFEAIGAPVIMENSAHQVVGVAPRDDPEVVAALSGWQEHSRTGHHDLGPGAVHRNGDGSPPCTWVGIWLRHELWGRIHVLEDGRRSNDATALLLDRAAVAVGLSMLSQQDAEHLADRAASAVIGDLLTGRYGSTAELFRRARSLGSDLSHGGLAALIVEAPGLAQVAAERHLTERDCQRIRLRLRGHLHNAVVRCGCVGLLGLDGDRVLAVVAAPKGTSPPVVLEQVTAVLQERLAGDEPRLSVIVAASREAAPDNLRAAFEEARVAAEFGRHSGGRALYQYGRLGMYPLLFRLAEGPELAAFVESELGRLLEHDAATKAKLLPTLRGYLECAGRKSQAVAVLHIQRRTLYARLARIEHLLGRDLNSQEARTCLTVALQGLDILRDRAALRGEHLDGSTPALGGMAEPVRRR